MTEHQHIVPVVLPRRVRYVVAGLSFLVMVLFGVLTWVLLTRPSSAKNSREIGQLACQVEQLGGQPVGGVHCPPAPSSTPSPSSKSRKGSHPPTSSPAVSGVGPFIGPTSSPRATTSPHPAPSPTTHPTQTPPPKPTPKPTPSSCANVQDVVKVCLTPLAVPHGLATVWLWL